MISGWLVKVMGGILVLGFLVIELGSPLIARAQADDAAHEVADQTAIRLRDSFTQETLDTTCRAEAEDESVELVEPCKVDAQGQVAVTVTKKARTVLLGKIDALADWYRPQASATAAVGR